ncbi:MAG: hypothetical protein B0W54_18485 [Cellvibrio sp. 79]|nr:MAG: hypothetical protein B0W54_18485 [Cellvibrio sp. 79]
MKTLNNPVFIPTTLSLAIALAAPCSFADFNDAGTDYSTAPQHYRVWNEALKPVDLVNSILCFTGQLKAEEFINKGPYLALADEGACFEQDGDDSASTQSAGAGNVPSYTKIIVNSTRASANDPLLVRVWIPGMGQGDEQQTIKFKSSITKGASIENPFGIFTFNYNFYASPDSNEALGGGEIKTIEIPGKIGFTFYEKEAEDQDRISEKGASVVMSSDRTVGIAYTFNHQQQGVQEQGDYYGLSFNASNVLTQKAETYELLPFNSNDSSTGSEACLSRTDFNESVWQYNLFDTDTGAKVAIKSGISFKYDADGDSEHTTESYGQVGYWGLWAEHPEALHTGDTIVAQNQNHNDTSVTTYSIVKAPGRLIKNTVQELTLANINGLQFNYWSPDAQQSQFQNWIVEYLTVDDDGVSSDGFYKVGGSSNGENGPTISMLQNPVVITLNATETLYMNSEQLGGPVKYTNGNNFVTFAKQEFINGSETDEGELLAGGWVTLYCVDRCPIGTLGAAQLSNWNSPYSDPISSVDDAMAFTFNVDGVNPLTLVRASNSEPVRYASDLTIESLQMSGSPYSWGVRSGSLVTADVLETLSTPHDIYNPLKVTVFYEWEAGLNSFNQMVSVKDSTGKIQTFDKPLQFTYTHTDAKDRSGDAGMFDGKLVLLNYSGNGQFSGIPATQDSDGRYTAAFTIADGTLMGPDNKYVIKAQEIEGRMKPTNGQCGDLALAEPLAPIPTATTDNANDIGEMPEVTGAPKVIAGEVQVPVPL